MSLFVPGSSRQPKTSGIYDTESAATMNHFGIFMDFRQRLQHGQLLMDFSFNKRNPSTVQLSRELGQIIYKHIVVEPDQEHFAAYSAFSFGVLLSSQLVPKDVWSLNTNEAAGQPSAEASYNFIKNRAVEFLSVRQSISSLVDTFLPAVCKPAELQSGARVIAGYVLNQVEISSNQKSINDEVERAQPEIDNPWDFIKKTSS